MSAIFVSVEDPCPRKFQVDRTELLALGRMLCVIGRELYIFQVKLDHDNTFKFVRIHRLAAPDEGHLPENNRVQTKRLATQYKAAIATRAY